MRLDLRVRLLGRAVAAATGPIAGMTARKRQALRHPRAPRRLRQWLNGSRAAGVSTVDLALPGPAGELHARVYRPERWAPEARLPVVVAFQGGGFVFGDLDTGEWLCSHVAAGAEAVVVSVAYRLAPEHPAPAAHLDAVAATAWVAAHAADLGGRAGRLAVLGDSSGGTLAAAVALAARDHGSPHIVFQALAYPITDLTLASPSVETLHDQPLLRSADLRAFIQLYLDEEGDARDPTLSPLLADDHTGLPPALILTADHDPLRDDGRRYATQLRHSGVPVQLVELEASPHGFFSFPRLCRTSAPALQILITALREAQTSDPADAPR